ncbi:hypothetical protein [Streptomyces chartreusis]|uniref:hypothetical protein n=1 Tax=Streptomyces chartreusis TaxID=1969 RepID=UPI003658D095
MPSQLEGWAGQFDANVGEGQPHISLPAPENKIGGGAGLNFFLPALPADLTGGAGFTFTFPYWGRIRLALSVDGWLHDL